MKTTVGNIKGITIQLGGDTTKLDKALASVNKQSKDLQKELQQVERLLKLDPKNTELLAQKQELLAKAVEATKTKLEALKQAQDQVNKAHAANADWEKQYAPLKKEIGETAEKMKKLASQEEEMKRKLNSGEISAEQYNKFQVELDETTQKHKELMQAKRDLDKQFADGHISDEQYRQFNRQIEEGEQRLKDLEGQLAATQNKLGQFGDSLVSAGGKLKDVGGKIEGVGKAIMPLSVGVAGIGTAIVATSANFEAAMSEVAAISGATGEELEALTEKAKEMGETTKFSASESAEALKYMAMAGWETSDMLNGLEGIMNLAAASGESLGTTSDIVTDALTAFGLQAKDSAHFSDVLAVASSSSNTNVGLMGETFKYVAPVAGALGYSIEDAAVAIGLMANSSIKGSQSGTALRTMFTRLSEATTETKNKTAEYVDMVQNREQSIDALRNSLDSLGKKEKEQQLQLIEMLEAGDSFTSSVDSMVKASKLDKNAISELEATFGLLGITTSDTEGKMKPLSQVLEELRAKTQNLSEADQTYVAKTLAGQEAMSGFLSILNATDSDFEKLTGSIANASGTVDAWQIALEGISQRQDILGQAIKNLGADADSVTEYLSGVFECMADGTESTEAAAWLMEDLGLSSQQAGELIDVMTDSLGSAEGAAKEMADIMNDNLNGQLTLLKSQTEGVALKLGETLLPVAKDVVDTVSEWVDAFSNLDEEQQKTILTIGGVVAAAGPLLTVGGKIVSGAGSLIGGVGGIVKAVSGLGTAAATATGAAASGTGLAGLAAAAGAAAAPVAGFVAAAAGIGAVGYAVYKGMTEEAVPAVNLFEGEISEATQTAVQSYLDMDSAVSQSLFNLRVNSETITGEVRDSICNSFSEMADLTVSAFQRQKEDSIKEAQALFSELDVLTSAEQSGILNDLDQHFNDQISKVESNTREIQEIYRKAAEEHRKTTEDENKEIDRLRQENKTLAVKALSDTEIESKAILERMKAYDQRMTAEQVGEHIKLLNEQRDKAVAIAEDEYEKQIAQIVRLRDESGVISEETANKMIEEAKRQKKDTIQQAEELREECVNKITDMCDGIEDEVNLSTGNIKSLWDSLKNWWESWTPSVKKFFAELADQPSTSPNSQYDGGFVGGKKKIPKYAAGTAFHPGGLAVVGEEGPELVSLPRGTQVLNNSLFRQLENPAALHQVWSFSGRQGKEPAASNHSSEIGVTVNLYADLDQNTGRKIGSDIAYELRRRGVVMV